MLHRFTKRLQLFGGFIDYTYLCTDRTKKVMLMTELSKTYRLTSAEEPTDEMLQELMEDVAKAARESSAKAEAEKQRRSQTVASEIEAWRKSTGQGCC